MSVASEAHGGACYFSLHILDKKTKEVNSENDEIDFNNKSKYFNI